MKERLIKFIKRIPGILLAGVKQFCRGLYRIGKAIIDYSQRPEPVRTERKHKIVMPSPVELNKRVNNNRINHDFLKPSGLCDTNLHSKRVKRYDMFSQSDMTRPSGDL